jgi:hypothetical protein
MPVPTPATIKTFTETKGEATNYIIALDLGQSRDWSALVINQRVEAERIEWNEMRGVDLAPWERQRRPMIRHNLVRLHRYPLGTSYPEIARSVNDVMRQLPTMKFAPDLVVDASGVGRPVVDQLRELGLNPQGVTITGGFGVSGTYSDRRIAKNVLACLLDVVLSEPRLKVPSTDPLAQVLIDELRYFIVKVTTAGNEQFAALRESIHDDLVLAAALGVWSAENRKEGARFIRLDWKVRARGLPAADKWRAPERQKGRANLSSSRAEFVGGGADRGGLGSQKA